LSSVAVPGDVTLASGNALPLRLQLECRRGTLMRPAVIARLAIAVAGVALAAGCATAPAGSALPTSSDARPATSAGAAPSASQIVGAPSGSATAVVWPAPSDPMARAVQAGLKPGPKEFLATHVHAHLDVFVDGKPVAVPSGIGINITDPAVRRFDAPDGTVGYGGIQLCNEPCISPLHTHDFTGILHTESTEAKPNTLGEFFIEWGVALDASCVSTFCSPATTVAIYVDGALNTGDPRLIELTNQREIAVVVGTPPAEIPKSADFSGA
jgi:hypothetical protein